MTVLESGIVKYFKNMRGSKNTTDKVDVVSTVSIADTKEFDDMKNKIDVLKKQDDVSGLTAMLQNIDNKLKNTDLNDKETIIKMIPIITTIVVAICKTHHGDDISEQTLSVLKDCKSLLERLAVHGGDKIIRKIDKFVADNESSVTNKE